MKGSGKQVLLKVLRDLSLRETPTGELDEASNRLRAGLLPHGSTSEENLSFAKRISWKTETRDNVISRQGAATEKGGVFVSDLFETMLEFPGLKEAMLAKYPSLSSDDFEAAVWTMWLLISSQQMFSELLPVEVEDSEVDIKKWTDAVNKLLNL